MIVRTMRFLGAAAILAVGAVHLQQYISGYRAIPTIGTLFLLNAIASAIVGIGLLAPIGRVSVARRAGGAIGMLALAGVAIAVGSLVALFLSESASLFGFSEAGYSTPIVIAIIAEAATVALLAPVAALTLLRPLSRQRGANRPPRGSRESRPDYSVAS